MRMHERQAGDVTVVSLFGRLVLGEATERLGDKTRSLLHQNRRAIVFDLGGVDYIDSGGLGQLITSFVSARNAGGVVKLANLPTRANDLLVTTTLDLTFERLETVDAAVRSFGH